MSGHIHELRIHVPWTKLGSEPVVITINTMECILKLKDGAQVSHSLVNGMGSFCETCSKAIQQTERDTQAFKLCFCHLRNLPFDAYEKLSLFSDLMVLKRIIIDFLFI